MAQNAGSAFNFVFLKKQSAFVFFVLLSLRVLRVKIHSAAGGIKYFSQIPQKIAEKHVF
jgi:hypothetical protein